MLLNQTSEWQVIIVSIFKELLLFNFERLDMSWASITHPSQKLWPFEFAQSFRVQFRASWYIVGLNRTSESKVMAVWIWLVLPCLISSISIYYASELDIQVKSYNHSNFPRASVVQFERLDISWASIIHTSQYLWPFEFALSFHIQFRASRYIIGMNRISESKVMAVWIFLALPWLISSVSIYYVPKLDIHVKSYDHLNFLRAYFLQFRVSRYIMSLNHIP